MEGAHKGSAPGIQLTRSPDAEQLFVLVIKRAAEVIGDRDEALRWVGTPVRALGYATPISLLGTHEGSEQVLAVLDRLEHGVL
jgi:putative toxin-antitoxin system antitoxin component (TIGR02293 family)